ncbi:4'-phosphopantetheinyl transferase superfamily protein [Nocardioides sp. SYSU D00065]|uniref:4'-phosphopantetheinyl transferase family protein n=1 Tax=Nocardioides sp. SYSU D00065 TaxID=2817378 RepID=UPI001B32B403|nr:4'-phosphopantetheinyl transferase superfamily protein [Nocardioides sp. SYSU D00065]
MYDVRWHATDTGARRALELHAAAHLRAAAGLVTSGRLCPRCGSSRHGRPWLRVGGTRHHVSLSRSGPHLLTAIADRPVGVDVESVAAVASRWDPGLVLAGGEVATDDVARARAWARKEAVLKARGTGLATPMGAVLLAEERWADLDAPEGYVAAVSWGGRGAGAP